MTIAVCPGSYDPVTAGHLDVIERSARFFDEVHVVVAVNAAKTPMFSEATRVDVIRRALDKAGCKNVTVSSTDGLITDYCKKVGATVIIKGLRQNGDYEAELGMALEVYSYVWDSLIPAVQSGAVDAIIAGMSPTAEREEQVDFTDCYYNSNLVVIIKK